jgi:hypothetical protein
MKLESILGYEFSNNSVDINVIDGGAIKLKETQSFLELDVSCFWRTFFNRFSFKKRLKIEVPLAAITVTNSELRLHFCWITAQRVSIRTKFNDFAFFNNVDKQRTKKSMLSHEKFFLFETNTFVYAFHSFLQIINEFDINRKVTKVL